MFVSTVTDQSRKFVFGCVETYRYSHNGQEKEDEVFSGAQSAEYWMYDSRIGRRWERDPIYDENLSPYSCFANNPIYFEDIDGLSPGDPQDKKGGAKKREGKQYAKNPDGSVYEVKKKETTTSNNKTTEQSQTNPQPQTAPTGGGGSVPQKESPKVKTNTILDELVGYVDDVIKSIKNDPKFIMFVMFDNYANNQQSKDDLTPPVHTKLSGLEENNPGPIKGRSIDGTGNVEKTSGGYPGSTLVSIGKSSPFGVFKPIGKGSWTMAGPQKNYDYLGSFGNINSTFQNGGAPVESIQNMNKPSIKISRIKIEEGDSVRKYPNSSSDPSNDTLYMFYKFGNTKLQKMYDGNRLLPNPY